MKIYTKTGDKGTTGLIGGTRIPKSDLRLEAYGTVDELNSFIGLLVAKLSDDSRHQSILFLIQNKLFSLGAYLATDSSKADTSAFLDAIDTTTIGIIEKEIDNLTENLPKLNSFILPGGSEEGALCHICRTIARRAERRIYDVNNLFPIENEILIFANRLSDYFFTLSRTLTKDANRKEISWK